MCSKARWQRDGNRVRVNAQLIDAELGAHLWADRFEEDLADLFKLQDDVVARLANTLGYELVKAEAEKVLARPILMIDLALRCQATYNANSTVSDARKVAAIYAPCDAALKLDPQQFDGHLRRGVRGHSASKCKSISGPRAASDALDTSLHAPSRWRRTIPPF